MSRITRTRSLLLGAVATAAALAVTGSGMAAPAKTVSGTVGPGFTVDEPLEHLGEKLSLPPDYEHLRERVEPVLTPLPNPRELVQR